MDKQEVFLAEAHLLSLLPRHQHPPPPKCKWPVCCVLGLWVPAAGISREFVAPRLVVGSCLGRIPWLSQPGKPGDGIKGPPLAPALPAGSPRLAAYCCPSPSTELKYEEPISSPALDQMLREKDRKKKQLTLSQWEVHVENIKVGKFLRARYFFQDVGKL